MRNNLNDFDILVYQLEYNIIVLIKDHLYEWEMWSFLWEFWKGWIFKAHINMRVVYGQNKHNSENQRNSLCRELYEYYCFVLHKS